MIIKVIIFSVVLSIYLKMYKEMCEKLKKYREEEIEFLQSKIVSLEEKYDGIDDYVKSTYPRYLRDNMD